MSCSVNDSTYSINNFHKEWCELSENIAKLSERISVATNRIQFESNLDQLNFDQMELQSKIKYLSEKDSDTAQCMMQAVEKTLTVLDNALYTPTINPKEEFCCLFMSSLQKGMALGLFSIIAKNLVGAFKTHGKEVTTMEEWKAYQDKIMDGLLACRHNGEETSVADILEHLGNGELGSIARDALDSQTVRDTVTDVLDAIGNEAMRIDD